MQLSNLLLFGRIPGCDSLASFLRVARKSGDSMLDIVEYNPKVD